MPATKHSRGGKALTDLILSLFQAHGRLLAAGDELVATLGLSSARWQVLGALAIAGRPLTVPAIGGIMGLTRQAVQKQVDLLLSDRLIELCPNPAHRRSSLVALTRAGGRVYSRASHRQIAWANGLATTFDWEDLEAAAGIVRQLATVVAVKAGTA